MQHEIRSSFWIIADAVKAFYEQHGCLPVPGGLPDMKAQSDVYIRLQNIYKAKARKDAAEVLASVRRAPGGDAIDAAEVDLFCKNAAFIKLIDSPDSGAERLLKVAGKSLPSLICPVLARHGPPSLCGTRRVRAWLAGTSGCLSRKKRSHVASLVLRVRWEDPGVETLGF